MPLRLVLSLAAACCSFGACMVQLDDTSAEDFAREYEVRPRCAEVPVCSIMDDHCQRAVLEVTACVRGDETPELPSIRILSRDELRDELSAAAPSDETPGSTRKSHALRKALGALQLVAPDSTLAETRLDYEVESIAAFYREDEQDIGVVSDNIDDRRQAMNELSHELTHYLQDIAGQLEVTDGSRAHTDEHLAREALSEGDAVLTSLRASVAMLGQPIARDRWLDVFSAMESEVADKTNNSESPLLVALHTLPYALSLRALTAAWQLGGHSLIDSYFANPPSSALDWLNDGTGPNWRPRAALRCYPPPAPEGFELIALDTLGMVGLYSLLGTQGQASILTTADLQDDLLAVYADPTASDEASLNVLVVWRMRFDDVSTAKSFAKRLAPLGLQITRIDDELTISASSDAALAPLAESELAECMSERALP